MKCQAALNQWQRNFRCRIFLKALTSGKLVEGKYKFPLLK